MNSEYDKINGCEYVDLGLPSGTLWASYDIGAHGVGEFGDLFMWGETVPRDPETEWSDDDHKYVSNNDFVKYCGRDNKQVLDPEDDAATSLWGNDWKMPSFTDWRELIKFCASANFGTVISTDTVPSLKFTVIVWVPSPRDFR